MSTQTSPLTSIRRTLSSVDMRAVAPFIALIVLIIAGAMVNPRFVGLDNLANVATRCAFIATIAVGATFVISSGDLDLSVGSMVAFVASVMILFMNTQVFASPLMMVLTAVLLAIALGALCGLFNGVLTTKGQLEPFIVTLGTMGIFRGLTTWLSQGGAITLQAQEQQALYREVYFGRLFGVPWPILITLAVALLGSLLMYRTRFGRHVVAVGSNREVARHSGINVSRVRLYAFMIQGLTVAVAVILYVPRLGSTSSTTGTMWELQAITAVVIGGTALKGGSGRVWGSIAGAFILELVGNIMLLSNFISEYLLLAIQGTIIILAMLVQRSLTRRA
ncbi:ABC transporter permease [Marivivens aquimaris]|uniref:ABC transporter permease n=1 Tax=Marivivens aquimaris TaxID=2774876 RepID=UPI001881C581|nr:ABC transporter permease [Marivivens aquimaris]